ncbi:phage tail spike protein [Halalkalibacterium halodurans]|uniref:phage tail spike protein n=2 Tax=Halalkalibacterium halodurans TaxID=86665 RepID=UPI002E1DB405|nr:phage tail spike protein [Halalkalibacterium halodurans]MED4082176.1 phage tail spike protein [Halalkalibacterium halodurans]MED4085700.1 phage tail spike protein [Halalkalibacterium halodurans]MED4106997.1 phage tail spike protein [Halalkalibacterium halodurans]MED4126381.1 phage tail spike protein [Halalkalibacterium halodurans]MED4188766.1 phage tail spike protein [Halalkalibacterium halodurans]
MTELFIFDREDQLLTILTESTGLVRALFREELNRVPNQPFAFTIEASSEEAKHVVEEHQVVFRDKEGDLRLFVIKELEDVDGLNGPQTTAICEPAFMELAEHMIVEQSVVNQPAHVALNVVLQGTRWTGSVEVNLGNATEHFSYVSAIEAVWNILVTWGGDFKDVVTFNAENKITSRQIKIVQRRGVDRGKRFEIDHNIEQIERTILSYPITALYGRGASLQGENGQEGSLDFGEVEWRKSAGAPVDKPKGQLWVGDPEALQKYGRKHNGQLLHREGIYQNTDIEDPEELLEKTWEQLQKSSKPEVHYRLSVRLFEHISGYEHEKASLGDTAVAIDRQFSRPIEIQSRIIAIEYDLVDIDGTGMVEMGQFLSLNGMDERLERVIEEIEKNRGKWGSSGTITRDKYPDIKPSAPVNLRAESGFQAIQLYWDYSDELYIEHYEVYGSQVSDFVPDSQHLLWRGKVSAFAHFVDKDQQWYYYVRAVNYHGRPSDWSDKVSGSTHRIISDDILFGPDLAERLRELNRISDIIGEGGVNFEQISDHAKALLNQEARQYTDEEIRAIEDVINAELAEKAGLTYVEGKFSLIDSELEAVDGKFVSVSTQLAELETEISLKAEQTQVDVIEGEVTNVAHDLSQLTVSVNGVQSEVTSIRSGIGHLEEIVNGKATEYKLHFSFNASRDYLILLTRADLTGARNYVAGTLFGRRVSGNVGSGKIEVIFNNSSNGDRASGYFEASEIQTLNGWSMVTCDYKGEKYIALRHQLPNEHDIWNTDTRFYGQIGSDSEMLLPVDNWGGNPDITNIQPFESSRPVATPIMRAETRIDQNSQQIALRATEINSLAGRVTQAEAELSVQATEIAARVEKDGIVTALNLSPEGIRIKGSLIHLDGTTLINDGVIQNAHIANAAITRAKLGTAVIGTAQIEDLAVTSAKISSVNADKINAASLSAISANLGTVTAGIMRSNNNNMELNLNTGILNMQNTSFRLGGSADIEFIDARNKMVYQLFDDIDGFSRTAGIGVGDSINSRYPVVYVGATGTGKGNFRAADASYFSGFIANTRARAVVDNIGNSVVGNIFHIRDQAINYSKGFVFDLSGSNVSMRPMNTGTYDYDIGSSSARVQNLWVNYLRVPNNFLVYNIWNSRIGWRMETQYSGDGHGISIYPTYTGTYNYVLGKTTNRLTNIFLKNNPNIQSDSRLKEDITDNELGLDFIKTIKTKEYRLKQNMADESKNPIQLGVIAQDILSAFNQQKENVQDYSLVTMGADGMYAIEYGQFVAPLIKSVQELDIKLDDKVKWLKLENQRLKEKITKLEEKIA